jgi:hypothetical protein
MEGQETKYPPFLMYANDTQTITFKPNSIYTQGQTYFFSITIKERHSSTVLYSYYCTIKISGDIVVKDNTLYWVNVNYTIVSLDNKCGGIMKFTEPVNMTYLKQNMYSMFNIYWQDINYKDNQLKRKLLDFEVTDWGTSDNMTIAF